MKKNIKTWLEKLIVFFLVFHLFVGMVQTSTSHESHPLLQEIQAKQSDSTEIKVFTNYEKNENK